MVNIHIRQFEPGGAVVDTGALEQFQKQWATYQKLVESGALAHEAVGHVLHDALMAVPKPFAFLDIACGDASQMKEVLPGTKIAHYHGIDLSEPAIELAAANLKGMPFEIDLDHQDFVAAIEGRPEPADVAWCGLSIHHLITDKKRELLTAIRASTRQFLMIYEPSRRDGEDRDGFLKRFFEVQEPLWKNLDASEVEQIEHHVRTSDLPETVSGWLELGRQAGFSSAKQVFADPTDTLLAFRYDI